MLDIVSQVIKQAGCRRFRNESMADVFLGAVHLPPVYCDDCAHTVLHFPHFPKCEAQRPLRSAEFVLCVFADAFIKRVSEKDSAIRTSFFESLYIVAPPSITSLRVLYLCPAYVLVSNVWKSHYSSFIRGG